MGSNAGPHVANIYLYQYEYKYIQDLIDNNDTEKLKKLVDIFRFQDDLLSINDYGLFGKILSNIYPQEMIINNTNISNCKTTFLDLAISIYRGEFVIGLYDKKKDYSFNVISYPFLDGNIPKSQSYGIFVSQLVRFCKVNNTFTGFIRDARDLVNKLDKPYFEVAALRTKFLAFQEKYFYL